MIDPAIDEIRRIRHEISLEAKHNLHNLKETLAQIESEFQRATVDHGKQQSVRKPGAAKAGEVAVADQPSPSGLN